VSRSKGPWDEEATAKPVDKEAERRELKAAGWRSQKRAREIVWQAPGGGLGALLCHGYVRWVKPRLSSKLR
jgi:hypothetical protein